MHPIFQDTRSASAVVERLLGLSASNYNLATKARKSIPILKALPQFGFVFFFLKGYM